MCWVNVQYSYSYHTDVDWISGDSYRAFSGGRAQRQQVVLLLGKAVQVDPIKPKPTLKPPGTKRLKLQCVELLSTSAFKFNLRRYGWGCPIDAAIPPVGDCLLGTFCVYCAYGKTEVARCRLTLSNPLESAWN